MIVVFILLYLRYSFRGKFFHVFQLTKIVCNFLVNKKTVKIKGNTNLSITGSLIWKGDKNGSFFHDFFYKKIIQRHSQGFSYWSGVQAYCDCSRLQHWNINVEMHVFERRPNKKVEAGNSWQDPAYTQWYSGMCFGQTMGIKVEGWSQAGGLECHRPPHIQENYTIS